MGTICHRPCIHPTGLVTAIPLPWQVLRPCSRMLQLWAAMGMVDRHMLMGRHTTWATWDLDPAIRPHSNLTIRCTPPYPRSPLHLMAAVFPMATRVGSAIGFRETWQRITGYPLPHTTLNALEGTTSVALSMAPPPLCHPALPSFPVILELRPSWLTTILILLLMMRWC